MEVEEVEPFHWYITDRSVKLFFITFFIFLLSFLIFIFLFLRYIRNNRIALFPRDDADNDVTTTTSASPTATRRQSSHSGLSFATLPAAALPSRAVDDLDHAVIENRLPVFARRMSDDGGATTRRFGGDECCICLGVFEEKEMVRVMPECMHVFHSQCIVRWLTARSNCPLCRSTIYRLHY